MSNRSTLLWTLLGAGVLATVLFVGCAEERSPADVDLDAHPSAWMDPESRDFHGASVVARGTASCTSCHGEDHRGEARATSCFDCHLHSENWLAPAEEDFHGAMTWTPDALNCAACHGEDLRGGWSAVSCYSACHDGPGGHPEGWISPVTEDFHGDFIREAMGVASCRACHGSNLTGGAAEISCYEGCHDGPGGHPFDWLDPEDTQFHGTRVGTEGTDDCKACHGTTLEGGWAGVSCATGCHSGASGHPEDWLIEDSADFHGDFVKENGAQSCETCHGADYQGGWTGVGCFNTCHEGPSGHPTGWTNLSGENFHGAFVIDAPGTDECKSCHGTDLQSGWAGVGCYEACHDGPGGHPVDWAVEGSDPFHGDTVILDGTDRCMLCHGEDLSGSWTEVSCSTSCHSGAGGHPEGWMIENSAQFHGDEVKDNGTGGCTSCHGTDLMGGWTAVSCYNSCHDGPGGHPADWGSATSSSFHGDAVIDAAGTDECTSCHGTDYLGGWAELGCYDTCHDGPSGHPENWLVEGNADFHGTRVALESADHCRECHGADLTGDWAPTNCYFHCHDGPGGHPSDWLDENSLRFHGDTVETNGTDECKVCHGDNLTGGWSEVSCSGACHSGPGGHPGGWMVESSPSFHGVAVEADSAWGCRSCHGQDYTGGWSEVSCYSACHDGPGGHPENWADKDEHGDYVEDLGGAGSCRTCHGSTYQGGWSGVSCFRCHDGPGGG